MTRTLTSLFFISPGGKTLNTCAAQVLREIREKIEIGISTDPINIQYFLFFSFVGKTVNISK